LKRLWNRKKWGENQGNENLKASIPNTNYDSQKQLDNVKYFNFLAALKQVMQDIHVKLNPVFLYKKQDLTRR
jgi:hypothetical protein